MSRIGRREIPLPDGVQVRIDGDTVHVKGKLGEISRRLPSPIRVEKDGNVLRAVRKSDARAEKALHGLARTLVANMVRGVTEGYGKTLELQGTGYRAERKGDCLIINAGFSHPVEFPVPPDMNIEVEKNLIKVHGIDKERVGTVSASIRSIKPPDAYKGKGIRYQNEQVKLKPGKSGA